MKSQEVPNGIILSKKWDQHHEGRLEILVKPRVLKGSRANILPQMVAIVLRLKRAFSFMVRITNQIRKLLHTNDPTIKEKLKPPPIPKSIQNIVHVHLE